MGNIGGILVLPSFQHAFGLIDRPQWEIDDRRGTIAAMLPAAGSVGALLAAPSADYIGRKWSVFFWGLTFVAGAALQMISDYRALLAGRFVGGLGVGASSMLTPQFLAENAPKSVRGSMTASYNLMIIMSLMLAFFVNYGVSLWNHPGLEYENRQWRVAMSIQLVPGVMMCLMIPFVPETPRYLISRGKDAQGLKNLCKLRKLPAEHQYIQIEYGEVQAQVEYEHEIRAGRSYWVVLQDIFTSKSNFQRFFLAVMLFLFHKLTGTDSLNFYAPEIFALIGVEKGSGSLLTTVRGGDPKRAVLWLMTSLRESTAWSSSPHASSTLLIWSSKSSALHHVYDRATVLTILSTVASAAAYRFSWAPLSRRQPCSTSPSTSESRERSNGIMR